MMLALVAVLILAIALVRRRSVGIRARSRMSAAWLAKRRAS